MPKGMIFEMIQNIVRKYNINRIVTHLCAVFGVSRSGYYDYVANESNRIKREEQEEVLRNNILKAFNYLGYKKGSRSIKMVLEQEFNLIYNRKCIQRIMCKYSMSIRKANPYRRMMKATKEYTVVPNRLNREFKQNIVDRYYIFTIWHESNGIFVYS